MLFFDEADAIATRRSTSVDQGFQRESNTVVNVLLQELESFNGVVIFATNLAANFDPAFERRIRTHVLFEMPGVDEREQIWRVQMHPTLTPLADDVNFRELAENVRGQRRRHPQRRAESRALPPPSEPLHDTHEADSSASPRRRDPRRDRRQARDETVVVRWNTETVRLTTTPGAVTARLFPRGCLFTGAGWCRTDSGAGCVAFSSPSLVSGDAGRRPLAVAATHATGASVCRQPEPSLRARFHQPPPPRASRQMPTVLVAARASVVSHTACRAPVNDRCTRYGCLADGPGRPHDDATNHHVIELIAPSCFVFVSSW